MDREVKEYLSHRGMIINDGFHQSVKKQIINR